MPSRREWIEAIQRVSEDVGRNTRQKKPEVSSAQSSVASDSTTKGSNKVSCDVIASMYYIIMQYQLLCHPLKSLVMVFLLVSKSFLFRRKWRILRC